MTVTVPTLSPHPTDAEQGAADLAVALNDWQGDGTGQQAGPLRTAVEAYAANVPDWYAAVPELHAAADRALTAAALGEPIEVVAEHARDLLDLVDTWTLDRSADLDARRHDAWRGEAPTPF